VDFEDFNTSKSIVYKGSSGKTLIVHKIFLFLLKSRKPPTVLRIKPIKIALFILGILGGLFGLMFLSQKGGIQDAQIQDDGFSYEGISLKYPTYKTFLELEKKNDSSLTRQDIIKVTEIVTPLEIETPENEATLEEEPIKELPDFSKIDTTRLERIRYPDGNPNFINELREKFSSKSCRIIHYGDSQIEGDRITGYLRNRLQHMYGGSGPGFIPVRPVYLFINFKIYKTTKYYLR